MKPDYHLDTLDLIILFEYNFGSASYTWLMVEFWFLNFSRLIEFFSGVIFSRFYKIKFFQNEATNQYFAVPSVILQTISCLVTAKIVFIIHTAGIFHKNFIFTKKISQKVSHFAEKLDIFKKKSFQGPWIYCD